MNKTSLPAIPDAFFFSSSSLASKNPIPAVSNTNLSTLSGINLLSTSGIPSPKEKKKDTEFVVPPVDDASRRAEEELDDDGFGELLGDGGIGDADWDGATGDDEEIDEADSTDEGEGEEETDSSPGKAALASSLERKPKRWQHPPWLQAQFRTHMNWITATMDVSHRSALYRAPYQSFDPRKLGLGSFFFPRSHHVFSTTRLAFPDPSEFYNPHWFFWDPLVFLQVGFVSFACELD